jgi:hypothetical protein
MKKRATLDDLRETCQAEKLKENTGWTLANRKVSLRFSKILIRLGVTANQASVSSIITGLVGALCFMGGTFYFNLVATFLLYVSLTLDQVDGELARYYGTVSLDGVYIDEIRHLLIYAVPLYFLSIAPAEYHGCVYLQIFGFIAALIVNLARVEDRLPLLMYTDRILLKNNFTKGSFSKAEDNCKLSDDSLDEKESKPSTSKFKIITKPIYLIYSMMADQVSILIFFLFMSVGDYFIYKYWGVNFFFQTIFIVVFSGFGSFVFIRTFFSHWRESWAIDVCNEIDLKNK